MHQNPLEHIPLDCGIASRVMYNVNVYTFGTELAFLVNPLVDGIALANISHMGSSRLAKVTFKGVSLP
ncbi:hypothetical protein HPB50_026506 [Hyalomma asiaticum]|uniref:Uncharacterized protein n=1 Tax=Hyalomma asiaticum TaxID=266040 RepID=A0ACB7STN8_HYAAI|nr:hypothetical protein HPB50_026506 [Hyalomma asiaticum]